MPKRLIAIPRRPSKRTLIKRRAAYEAMIHAGPPSSVARLIHRLRTEAPTNGLVMEAAVGLEDLALQVERVHAAEALIARVRADVLLCVSQLDARIAFDRRDSAPTEQRERGLLARSLYDSFQACAKGGA